MSESIPHQPINNDQTMHEAILEVRAFIQHQTEERTKAEVQARQDRWTRYAALSMAFIALIAGYTMSKSGDCASRMTKDLSEATYNQTQASDQWSFYQSKAQKQLLTELEVNLRAVSNTDGASLDDLKKKISRYDKEKADIKAGAEKFEGLRNTFRSDAEQMAALAAKFGKSAQTFQIGLAVGGLCLLSKKKWLWYITLGVAAAATYLLVMTLL
jgi:hypothetical protein